MAGELACRPDDRNLLALLAHGNLRSGRHLERRHVYLAAVHMNVAVAYELARLAPRNREAEAIHNIVEARFELLQQALTGDAPGACGNLEVGAELPFLAEVDALGLLLLAKLEAVADDFRLAIFAVLARREVAFLNRTLVSEALRALEEELHAFTTTKPAYCVF